MPAKSRAPKRRPSHKPLRFLSPISRASRAISARFETEMAESGLSSQEGHLISYLAAYSPVTVSTLGDVFGMKASTLTSMLGRLEERGLLVRRMNEQDRRSLLVELRPAGERLAEEIKQFIARVESDIARRITAEDERGFLAVIAAIDQFRR